MYKKRTIKDTEIAIGAIKDFENCLILVRTSTANATLFFMKPINKSKANKVKNAPYQLVNMSNENESKNPDIETFGLFL